MSCACRSMSASSLWWDRMEFAAVSATISHHPSVRSQCRQKGRGGRLPSVTTTPSVSSPSAPRRSLRFIVHVTMSMLQISSCPTVSSDAANRSTFGTNSRKASRSTTWPSERPTCVKRSRRVSTPPGNARSSPSDRHFLRDRSNAVFSSTCGSWSKETSPSELSPLRVEGDTACVKHCANSRKLNVGRR